MTVKHEDVQISYLIHGVDGVKSAYESGAASKGIVRKAMRELEEAKLSITELKDWAEDAFGPCRPGRVGPRVGEVKNYKAQQVNDGSPFLRLPLDTLKALKGELMRVTFESDRIIVERVDNQD